MVAHKLIAIHPVFYAEFKGELGKQLCCEGEGDGRSPATQIVPDSYTRVAGEGRGPSLDSSAQAEQLKCSGDGHGLQAKERGGWARLRSYTARRVHFR